MAKNAEALEQVFVQLVDKSWQRYKEQELNRRMDDLLVGAVITANVKNGWSLIDLNSDGVNHYLRFEHPQSHARIIFDLSNMAESLVAAKTLGRHARVTIGYGQQVNNFAQTWQIFKAEMKSAFIDRSEPGTVTFDADMAAGYVYVQVPLLLDLDPYFAEDYQVNYRLIQGHLQAVVHSLRKYLQGRLGAQ